VSASRFWMVTRGVAWRSLHNSFVNPAVLVPSLVFPLFFLVAFAGGLSSLGSVPGFGFRAGYTSFQYVFVLEQSAAFGGVFTGFAIARDFEVGFGRRLLLAAPRRSGIVAGYALSAMVRSLFTAAVVTVGGLIGGMRVLGDGVDVLGLVWLTLLISLVATLWACGVAMRLRTIQAGSLMQIPVFTLLFLAPVYVPEKLLTGWISTAARINPITPLLAAGRGFIAGEPASIGVSLAVLAAAVVLMALWSRGGLRAAERVGG